MSRGQRKPTGPGRRHRWSPVISDAPYKSEEEREVSEGRGLGEERLGGWRTEKREESRGTGQILMVDGASMLGRATRCLALEGGAQLWWLERG
jgi:hypothetical protein